MFVAVLGMGLRCYDGCSLDLCGSIGLEKYQIKFDFMPSSSLRSRWLLVGLVRRAERSNPLSSPRCKVYPYEIRGQSLEKGENL